jgi:hypothetical protein
LQRVSARYVPPLRSLHYRASATLPLHSLQYHLIHASLRVLIRSEARSLISTRLKILQLVRQMSEQAYE